MATIRHYVYLHKKKTDGAVFYVGKGFGKRAWKKSTRSDWWKRIEAKYGRDVEIYKDDLSENDAFRLEAELIAFYGRENLCNLTDGGEGGINPSDETRRKMSIARIGRKDTPGTTERRRIASTGKTHTEETKAKLRAINLGNSANPWTEASRRKLSESLKGRVRSEEHCINISLAKKGKKGRKLSDEEKKAISLRNTGKKPSDEARKKMSESSTGKKHSADTVAKMTEHNKRNNALRKKPVSCSNGLIFDSTGDAVIWLQKNTGYNNASRGNIVACANGKLKTAYGFTWQHI